MLYLSAMAVNRPGQPRVKSVDKSEINHNKVNKKKQNEDPRVLLIAQEIRFAKNLAGNDKKKRDRSLKNLKRWFSVRSQSSLGGKTKYFMKIWKGLFYSVWMSDKPLIQEELCENIASTFECFTNAPQSSVMFLKCGLETLATEWFGLDQHRMDKFLMFVRRIIRGMFRSVRHHKWSMDMCKQLTAALSDDDGVFCSNTPVYARNALGLMLHITDVWNEELAKVSDGDIPSDSLIELLKPFAYYLARGNERRLCSSISKNIFTYLLKQSDIGIEYEDKANAWRRVGCPRGGVDAMVAVDSDEEEVEEVQENGYDSDKDFTEENEHATALDPRAGRVDVVLPQLKPDAGKVAELLRSLTTDKLSKLTNRNKLKKCAENFEALSQGRYPLTVKEFELPTEPKFQLPNLKQSAVDLFEYDMKVEREADELRLKGLNRKRKRKLLKEAKMNFAPDNIGLPNGISSNDSGDDAPHKAKRRKITESKIKNEINKSKSRPVLDNTKKLKLKKNTTISKFKQQAKAVPDFKRQCKTFPDNKKSKKESELKRSKPALNLKQAKTVSKLKKKDFTSDQNKGEKSPVKHGSAALNSKKSATIAGLKKNKIVSDFKQTKGVLKKVKLNQSLPKDFRQREKRVLNLSQMKTASNLKQKNVAFYSKEKNSSNGWLVEPITGSTKKKESPKKVKFALIKNSSQGMLDYYKSVRRSPTIPFDGSKVPVKTLLKPHCTPSPVNPFVKKKLRLSF